ncbi:MAG: DUF3500 domain-containing protein [Chloroflexota bacterium]|nr:DUF3500 domain-containing protein [Chloroflexota bacterium]MDE2683679.1 DUF3500 domain-containing protein [Chloroflexota bacterium]
MTTAHTHDHPHAHPQAAGDMRGAALALLNSLDANQKSAINFSYYDGERIFWYYPPLNRHGLQLRDMNEEQRKLAYALMATGLTEDSNRKAQLIIEHEAVLGPLEQERGRVTFVRDPLLYAWTIFGDPANDGEPWGWRVEGHHVSLHYSVWGDRVLSMTPFFFGANPAEVPKGPKQGLRILGDSQDIALELMESLDAGQKSRAMIYDEAPADIITFNSSRASLPKEEGLPASAMSGTQREMLMALASEYVTRIRADLAEDKLTALREGGLEKIHLAWGGPVDRRQPHYYRLHGGDFVVEYDNRQNGANHIHSVLRDVNNDFAADVMRDHLLMYHVL